MNVWLQKMMQSGIICFGDRHQESSLYRFYIKKLYQHFTVFQSFGRFQYTLFFQIKCNKYMVMKCIFIILVSFFDEQSNFCNRILTSQKQKLVSKNCKWNCMFKTSENNVLYLFEFITTLSKHFTQSLSLILFDQSLLC